MDAVLKMLSACSGDNRFREVIMNENQGKAERKVTTMCEVLDKIVARGEARGEDRGEARGRAGIVQIIRRKLEKHMGVSEIAELLELEEDYVADMAFLLMQSPEKSDVEIAGEYLSMKKES